MLTLNERRRLRRNFLVAGCFAQVLGKTNEFLMPDHSIDNVIFGIKAVDQAGNESLVTPFVPTGRTKRTYETY